LFSSDLASLVETPLVLARVCVQDRETYLVLTVAGERRVHLSGAARHQIIDARDLPVVGDYVALDPELATIRHVLPRTNLFARRAVGGAGDVQNIAANVDRLFVTVALNRDFNLRRVERYLVAAGGCGVPVGLVLTKSDLVEDPQPYRLAAEAVAGDAPVVAVCALDAHGLPELSPFRGPGKTLAFVGSSGAGKSTLVNALVGEERLAVGAIRSDDDRGRHTTTRRELIVLDDGTCVIDTPGMRELALAGASEDVLDAAFDDIATLALTCRFSDCSHETEPGCAVRDGVDEGRLASWRKLRREAAFELRKTDRSAALAEKRRWKAIHVANRRRSRDR